MITVVTPSFNQGKFIREAVESVRAQGYPFVEHIVVDNCSNDNTADILSGYPGLEIVREPDRGQSDALNKGFRRAKGDIIGWLNADDSYLPGCFERVSRSFEEDKSADVVYGDYRLIDEEGRTVQNRRELDFDLFMLKYLHVLPIPSTASFFRRRIFDEGHFLDEDYRYSMDYDFFLRLALRGFRFRHIPQVMANFRAHGESKSFTGTRKQLQEKRRSLMANDPFMRRCFPLFRQGLCGVLTAAARTKRTFLKGCKGYYWRQWKTSEAPHA